METGPSSMYPCPCCGYRTFAAPPRASYILCPVCYWEDLPQPQLAIDRISLHRAQRAFLETGAADPRYRDAVRPPEPHEQRPDGWQSIDDTIETLTQQIAVAFAGVEREDGITLHEADVLDGYGSDEERAAARKLDTDRHWTEVEDELLAQTWTGLNYLDDKGFRYYLPAYMRWALRHYDTTSSAALGSLPSDLTIRPWHGSGEPGPVPAPATFRILNDQQAQTVCRFLRFLVAYGDPYINVEQAQEALDMYWARFCANSAP